MRWIIFGLALMGCDAVFAPERDCDLLGDRPMSGVTADSLACRPPLLEQVVSDVKADPVVFAAAAAVQITLCGANFDETSTVFLNDKPLEGASKKCSNSPCGPGRACVTVDLPKGSPGPVTISLQNRGGQHKSEARSITRTLRFGAPEKLATTGTVPPSWTRARRIKLTKGDGVLALGSDQILYAYPLVGNTLQEKVSQLTPVYQFAPVPSGAYHDLLYVSTDHALYLGKFSDMNNSWFGEKRLTALSFPNSMDAYGASANFVLAANDQQGNLIKWNGPNGAPMIVENTLGSPATILAQENVGIIAAIGRRLVRFTPAKSEILLPEEASASGIAALDLDGDSNVLEYVIATGSSLLFITNDGKQLAPPIGYSAASVAAEKSGEAVSLLVTNRTRAEIAVLSPQP